MTESSRPPINLVDVQAAGVAIRLAIAEAEGPFAPRFLVEFLLKQWRRYLALLHHRHGPMSADWAHAMDTTRRLLCSVLPVATLEDRSRLLKYLPRLIADLKIGAAVAGIAPADRDAFLAELRELHIAQLGPRLAGAQRKPVDLSDTIAMNVRDPRFRDFLDKLDGADSVEHIEM